MELSDFTQGRIWSIIPEHLDSLTRKFHEFPSSEDTFAKIAPFNRNDKSTLAVKDDVAIIPIIGPISKRTSFFSFFFGGTSIRRIDRDMREALERDDVEAIVLDIDSPGGTIGGLESLSDLIFEAREQKPIVSFANGLMASAAYWIGSAASSVIAESTAQVGSIGVLMIHYDFSEWDRKDGVKRTFLTAGKYKVVGNDAEPLSQEAREVFQGQLDYFYSLFIDSVARNRTVSTEQILQAADGKVFIGRQAVDVGLVDKLGNIDTALDVALSLIPKEQRMGGRMMSEKMEITTVKQLAATYPDLAEKLREQGAKTVNVEQIRTEAAGEERARILGLVNVQFGEEAGEKFKAVVDTGVTVDQFQAIRAVQPPAQSSDEDKTKEAMLAAIQNAGAENPGSGDPPRAEEKDFTALVEAYRLQHKVGKIEAMQAIMKENPKAHEAYLQKANAKS